MDWKLAYLPASEGCLGAKSPDEGQSIAVSLLEPILFITSNDQDNETECKSANDTKPEGEADTQDSCAAIQRDFDKLEKWINRNLTEFSKRKCQNLRLGRNNLVHRYRLGNEWLESRLAGKDTMVLVDNKLSTTQQCALVAKVANRIPGCFSQSIASRSRKFILALHSTALRNTWSIVSSAEHPSAKNKVHILKRALQMVISRQFMRMTEKSVMLPVLILVLTEEELPLS